MIREIRNKFNKEFSESKYNSFLNDVWSKTNGEADFRICETPLFIDRSLNRKLLQASEAIISRINSIEFKAYAANAIPPGLIVPGENAHPKFFQIDFAITKIEDEYSPQLIELQGFPSLYAFQAYLDIKLREHFEIPEDFSPFYSGLNFNSYIDMFKSSLLGTSDPATTFLLELAPQEQKTRIDFILTKEYTGVDSICITQVYQRGKELFVKRNGSESKIERIYNRVIFDELAAKKIKLNFDIHDELQVEWIGHPNWFFKLSKHTIPFLKNEFVPETFLLSELAQLPPDLHNFVLKPLYSFAGSGVKIDVTESDLEKITDKGNYILMKKINYASLIETRDEPAKAEVRLMFIWDDKPMLVNSLLRTSKGKMMGVDFNKNKTWVGASTAFHQL